MTHINSFNVKQNEFHYELKKKDEPSIRFTLSYDELFQMKCNVTWWHPIPHMRPYKLGPASPDVLAWLEDRFIPKNRAFVEKLLDSLEESRVPKLIRILNITLGLSLTDDFWVIQRGSDLEWKDHNLFHNQFTETLSLIAFTGYGDAKVRGFSSSPEFTTDGMLRKCWRRIDDKVYLFKGGTDGAANAGNEPYTEYYASQIAEVLELNAVKYELEKWKGILCSTCELFTNEDVSLVTAHKVFGNMHITEIFNSVPRKMRDDLKDMFVFDMIIANQDRHFNNFGILGDNYSGKPIGVAPIFDNGISLLNYAMWDDMENLSKYYADKDITFGRLPWDFLDPVKGYITDRMRSKMKDLLDFKFKRHPKYNFEEDRLEFIEKFVKERTTELLKEY